jgi:predicted RNA-binding protein with PUA-like domain
MSYWILKTEPSTYSFADLARAKTTVWDGVKNPLALKHLRAMAVGDDVLIYHTGAEKAAVGLARVTKRAYSDPKKKDSSLVVVDIRAGAALPSPVPLAAIRADPAFRDLALVRMPRLSVVPATPAQWKRLLHLAGRLSKE